MKERTLAPFDCFISKVQKNKENYELSFNTCAGGASTGARTPAIRLCSSFRSWKFWRLMASKRARYS